MEGLIAMTDIEYWKLTNDQKNIFNNIKELPNCENLRCRYWHLRKLPNLPNCVELRCHGNKLRELPDLPKCTFLDCSENYLRKLPELPECRHLECGNNYLTELPELPNCWAVYCRNNRHLTYSESLAKQCRMQFPSQGYYSAQRERLYDKLKKVNILRRVGCFDVDLALEIVRVATQLPSK